MRARPAAVASIAFVFGPSSEHEVLPNPMDLPPRFLYNPPLDFVAALSTLPWRRRVVLRKLAGEGAPFPEAAAAGGIDRRDRGLQASTFLSGRKVGRKGFEPLKA
jgi:hypothetical protein